MPEYSFYDSQTRQTFSDFMTIVEKEQFLATNPHINQLLSAPAIGDSIRLGLKKPDSEFRDLLKRIKNKHSSGITSSNINTF